MEWREVWGGGAEGGLIGGVWGCVEGAVDGSVWGVVEGRVEGGVWGDVEAYLERARDAEHGARAPVDGVLDLGERRVHNDVGDLQLHVDIEEGPFVEQEAARLRARADAPLDGRERRLRALEDALVHEAAEVGLQLGHVGWLHREVGVGEGVAEDQMEQVGDALLHLEVLRHHRVLLLVDVLLLLHRDEPRVK